MLRKHSGGYNRLSLVFSNTCDGEEPKLTSMHMLMYAWVVEVARPCVDNGMTLEGVSCMPVHRLKAEGRRDRPRRP